MQVSRYKVIYIV